MTRPLLSIIVISYNIQRELPRTLYSLSAEFQKNIRRQDYEILVIDNGSRNPPTVSQFAHLDMDLSIHSMVDPTHSPIPAINFGLNMCCGEYIGVMIDGARIVSPGLLSNAFMALQTNPRTVVGCRGSYLGTMNQRDAIPLGYNAEVEDQLLKNSNWMKDGYNLFNISVFDESAGATWFSPIAESNALFMKRQLWSELNGYSNKFLAPGGGVANLDIWERALQLPECNPVVLLGESSFHQVHGGIATNGRLETIDEFFSEYESIYGFKYRVPSTKLHYWGSFPEHIHFELEVTPQ